MRNNYARIRLETASGTIQAGSQDAVELADAANASVELVFNDRVMVVRPGSDPRDVRADYFRQFDARVAKETP